MALHSFARTRFRPVVRGALLVGALAFIAGCGGGKGGTEPPGGSLAVVVLGLPSGADGSVRITGPRNFGRMITRTTTLTNLAAGDYTIVGEPVTPLEGYEATPGTQVATVGSSAASATVTYTQTTGAISITLSGMPSGGSGTLTVTGPNGFTRQVTSSTILHGLAPGAYLVVGTSGQVGGCILYPDISNPNVNVAVGSTSPVNVNFSTSSGSGYNLCIERVYLVQAVQRLDGSIPLVAGRQALLRVFLRGSALNPTALPRVRARFYNSSGGLVHDMFINPAGAVPTGTDEGTLANSWNALVPGSVLAPGLSVLVEADPDNLVVENDKTDNVFPLDGTPRPLDVRATAPLRVRFFPIQQGNGTVGAVDAGNVEHFLLVTRAISPVAEIDHEVGGTFVTSHTVTAQNTGGQWQLILQDLESKRLAEQVPGQPQRHYIGVLNPGYTGGVAGIAYVGGWTSLVWHHLQSNSASWVLAHELGHNWGRLHVSGCQNPTGIDHQYPHTAGSIGVYGYNPSTGTIFTPAHTDIMTYCNSQWISDYNYQAILNFRSPLTSVTSLSTQPVMIVMGRVRNGRVEIGPTFVTEGVPSLPRTGGRFRLEGRDAQGGAIFSIPFDPMEVADLPGAPERHFTYAIPLSASARERLHLLSVTGGISEVRRPMRSGSEAMLALEQASARPLPSRYEVRWDRTRTEAVMVRNARTREVLAIMRAGTGQMPMVTEEIELIPADAPRAGLRRTHPAQMR